VTRPCAYTQYELFYNESNEDSKAMRGLTQVYIPEKAPKSLCEVHFMQRHSVCYNFSGAFGLSSTTLPLPNHRIEFYISLYSGHHSRASFKWSYLDDNFLIGFINLKSKEFLLYIKSILLYIKQPPIPADTATYP
jgi:hypothetical protein